MKKLFAVVASVAMLAFAVPAMAQGEGDMISRIKALETSFKSNWKFYGIVFFDTFYDTDSAERFSGQTAGASVDNTDSTWDMRGITRIGARAKIGDISGRFEYGHDGRGNGNNTDLRHIYAEWNFGPGKLLLGQTDPLIADGITSQARGGFGGFGDVGDNRTTMMRLSVGSLKVAAVRPNKVQPDNLSANLGGGGTFPPITPGGAAIVAGDEEANATLPQIQVSYDLKTGPVSGKIAGAYQSTEWKVHNAGFTAERTFDVDAYILMAEAEYNLGPWTFGAVGNFGENYRNLDVTTRCSNTLNQAVYNDVTDSLVDAEVLGFALALNFNVNDMVKLGAGYGESRHTLSANGIEGEQKVKSYYLQAPLTLAKGVRIIPEIGKKDYGDIEYTGAGAPNPVNQGDMTYFGARWQISF